MRNLLMGVGLTIVKLTVGLAILAALLYGMSSDCESCGGVKCWTDAQGNTVCNYCNCDGQCF